MVCKEEGDRFFRKPVLVLGFHPYLSPYVVHLCCALFVGGGLPTWGGGRLFARGGPVCRMYDTCPLDEIQDLKVS